MGSGKQRSASAHADAVETSDGVRLRGVVQRLYAERGFGFLRMTEGPDIGQDVFFHVSGLEGFHISELEEGHAVEFEVRPTPKGKRAERVQRLA